MNSVTDISAAANVGGAEFTTRTIATQVVPSARDAQRDPGLYVIWVRGEILSCHGHGEPLTRYRRVLGEDHPDTLTSAANLARNLHALGEHEHARQLEEYVRAHRKG